MPKVKLNCFDCVRGILKLNSSATLIFSCVLCAVVVVILYKYFDAPLAFIFDNFVKYFAFTKEASQLLIDSWLFLIVAYSDDVLFYASLIGLGVCFLLVPREKYIASYQKIAVFCMAVIFAEVFKDNLKVFFGRSIPKAWHSHTVSLIDSGNYGFHFLHGGSDTAFPSGHMAVFAAALTVLAIFYPRCKGFFFALGVLLALGMVVMNFHFLGDVIAGTFLGVVIALGVHRLVLG